MPIVPKGTVADPINININQSSITGNMDVGGDLAVTGNAAVTGTASAGHLKDTSLTSGRIALVTTGGQLADLSGLSVSGNDVAAPGKITAVGDLAAAGGFRQSIGPFYVTMAADQTAVGLKFGDTINQAWVAPRAGSITAVSAMIDTAVTGSTKNSTVKIYKALAASPTSFSAVNAALDLAFTSAGSELALQVTAAKDTYTFAAGDLIKVVYTSNTITSTPKCVATVEIEC